jgi:CRISPR type I-E-associated protein CasA/Cse1
MALNYNLLEEQWVPVLWTDSNKVSRIGILEALRQANRVRQIAASNPMDRVAIFRFLLALLYWCRGNPPTETDTVFEKSFPVDWFSKLETHKEYFNLLGEGKRFYQDSGATRLRAITDLIQEVPTGNNFWHFRHSTDKIDGLCPACCAMGLLRLPLFSVSGLPDLKAGINGTPPSVSV